MQDCSNACSVFHSPAAKIKWGVMILETERAEQHRDMCVCVRDKIAEKQREKN